MAYHKEMNMPSKQEVEHCLNELELNPNYKKGGSGASTGSVPNFSDKKKTKKK